MYTVYAYCKKFPPLCTTTSNNTRRKRILDSHNPFEEDTYYNHKIYLEPVHARSLHRAIPPGSRPQVTPCSEVSTFPQTQPPQSPAILSYSHLRVNQTSPAQSPPDLSSSQMSSSQGQVTPCSQVNTSSLSVTQPSSSPCFQSPAMSSDVYIQQSEIPPASHCQPLVTSNLHNTPLLQENATFATFTEFQEAQSHYEQVHFCKLYTRRSRTIESALKRTPNKHYNTKIKFSEMEICCIHGGKKFKSTSTGKRPNQM